MKKRKSISELVSRLDERFYQAADPVNDTGIRPSLAHIKALALEKVGAGTGKERKKMKRMRILLIAAALAAVLGVTVLAMGGLEYFRGMFGDSVNHIADGIWTPAVTAEGDGGCLIAAEALLSDGYQTNLVFSTSYPENVENKDSEHLRSAENGETDPQGFQVAWIRMHRRFPAASKNSPRLPRETGDSLC